MSLWINKVSIYPSTEMKIFTFILDLILSLVSASYPAANRAEEKLVTPTYIHSSSVLNYDFEVLCGFLLLIRYQVLLIPT